MKTAEPYRFTGYYYRNEALRNLREQKELIRPVIQVFKGYGILVLGDREFHSVKLANWLDSKGIDFVLRQKQGTYIQRENHLRPQVNV